ncbi:N-acetyltransferase [Rhodopirellula baltica]|nr:N-acetyltransferase [Rhodopirellula baltica]
MLVGVTRRSKVVFNSRLQTRPPMPEILVSDSHAEVREQISRLLSQATEASGQTFSPRAITLALMDSDRVVGGLSGTTNWEWLYIETLAVAPEFQKQGFAKQLVMKAEEIARERGCCGSWVDTFTFQVPTFYLALGYEKFGELPNYPKGHSRIFLRKLFI